MRIDNEIKLDFKDVLIRPQRSTLTSRADVNLVRSLTLKYAKLLDTWDGIPIIAANMDHTGTIEMHDELVKHGLTSALHKFYSIDQLVKYLSKTTIQPFITIGISNEDIVKISELNKALAERELYVQHLCVDVANGYTEKFSDTIKKLRDELGNRTAIMAGNVVTADMTQELILAGADIVKIGIGPGSVCTTRKMTGVGYPQLSAIIECADAAHGLGGLICADGGITVPGDLAKAFGAGADFVMCGGIFAGHDECSGQIIDDHGKWMKFHGMSSTEAMQEHYGGKATYRASEGKEVIVPYRGRVSNTIGELLGGLRSSCTYVGAASLKELSKRTTFVRVTQQINEVFGKS